MSDELGKPSLSYTRRSRNLTTALAVAGVLAALLAAWLWLDAATWLMLLLGAFTLPALYDLAANPVAGFELHPTYLRWYSGRHEAQIACVDVDHVRLDTRLDFSVRASVVLRSTRKLRVPFEATPPHRALETALEAAGIKVQRHHFQLMQ